MTAMIIFVLCLAFHVEHVLVLVCTFYATRKFIEELIEGIWFKDKERR